MTHTKQLHLIAFALFFNVTIAVSQTTMVPRIEGIDRQLYWENSPLKAEYKNGNLTIVSGEKTDMFRDPNATYNTDTAPKLLFEADSNFVLTATITHEFKSKWDGGAIVLKADSANWIKFCYEKDYTGARRVVSVVTKNISDDCNSMALSSNTIHFAMAKAGKVITLYYSTDKKTWILVRHLQFESAKPLKVGFLSQSPTGKSCTVTFSDIRYEIRKIKDPYAPEIVK